MSAFFYWDSLARQEPAGIRWLVLIIGLGFLGAGVRPRNWKPWKYFSADKQGMQFPSECPQTANTRWLRVPWERIGTLKEEVLANGSKGMSVELRIEDSEISEFFGSDRLAKKLSGRQLRENGYLKIGYSNAFQRTGDAVRALNDLRG